MEVITRAEFDDAMRNFATKDDLSEIVTSVKETLKERLEDLRVDLFAQIEDKVTRSHNLLQLDTVNTTHLKDAKCEILATTRRNINDAIAPLATKAEMANGFEGAARAFESVATGFEGVAKGFGSVGEWFGAFEKRFDSVDKGFENLDKRFDSIDERFDRIDQRFDEVGLEFLKMGARLDAMEHKINTVVMDGFTSLKEMMESFTTEMRATVKHHEQRLDQHDADLYKLRQSGVLN